MVARATNDLSSWDDYPVHQIAEPIRHVGTSDRNFYDRYYFNLHGSSNELFLVMGLAQYPNLGVQDAFAVVRRGPLHRVVRASRVLGDRMDTTVGPFRVEVVEPLRKLRVQLGKTEHGLSFDLLWEGSIPAIQEPRHFIRKHGRVLFDCSRLGQTGYWSGTLTIGDETLAITPDRWRGARDRSWGVRTVGEVEPPGIRGPEPQMTGMWIYAPMQFADHTIQYILNETDDGKRPMEEAVRVWSDPAREPEPLGRPECRHTITPGTRMIESSVLYFPEAPGGAFEVQVTPLTHCFIAVGTGYGVDPDWRHGMYQGELVVQGKDLVHADLAPLGQLTLVDHVARFQYGNRVGYGLFEHAFIGPFARYGIEGGVYGSR
jgi:hypothetical protein